MHKQDFVTRLIAASIGLVTAACQPVRLAPEAAGVPAATESAAPAGASESQSPQVTGTYSGTLSVAGMTLDIVVTLNGESGNYSGSIDIPQQKATGIPLHDVCIALPALHMEMLSGQQLAVFDGEQAADGSISGKFTQAGYEGAFALAPRANLAVPAAQDRGGIASTYVDPDSLYSVPIPTSWTVADKGDYVILTDPEEDIKVYLQTVEGNDIPAAIAAAWKQVDSNFHFAIKETLDAPSAPGVEKTIVINYTTNNDTQLVQAAGQLLNGVIYINLFDAQVEGLQKRGSQISIISSGFKILAQKETDLSTVQPLTVTAAITEPLEVFIDKYMNALKIPGAAVGIVQDGKLVYAKGFGVANPETGAPITPETHMMIGSTGKSLTTMMMGTLVDDGLMAWDTPAMQLYPEFKVKDPELTQTITMRNLVCACTGVPRRDMQWLFNYNSLTPTDTVTSLARFDFFTKFGEAFQYSNQMVATAGYIAGQVASNHNNDLMGDYVNALQERVLDPAGMVNTTLSFDLVEQRGDYAIPHTLMLDGAYAPVSLDIEKSLITLGPAGAHWSTLDDMARYMITQLADGVAPDGKRVVSAENLNVTREPQIAIDATTQYGLGWMITKYKGQSVITHGGNTFGFTSEFTFLPNAKIGVIVLTNARASNGFNSSVSSKLLELVFEQQPDTEKNLDFYLEQRAKQVKELETQLGKTVDAAAVAVYLGTFHNDELGDLVLDYQDGKLTLDAGEFRTQLLPYDNKAANLHGYIVMNAPLQGAVFKFQNNDAGEPIIVFGQGVDSYTFVKNR